MNKQTAIEQNLKILKKGTIAESKTVSKDLKSETPLERAMEGVFFRNKGMRNIAPDVLNYMRNADIKELKAGLNHVLSRRIMVMCLEDTLEEDLKDIGWRQPEIDKLKKLGIF